MSTVLAYQRTIKRSIVLGSHRRNFWKYYAMTEIMSLCGMEIDMLWVKLYQAKNSCGEIKETMIFN